MLDFLKINRTKNRSVFPNEQQKRQMIKRESAKVNFDNDENNLKKLVYFCSNKTV